MPCVRKVTPGGNFLRGYLQLERNIDVKMLSRLTLALLVCAMVGVSVSGCNTFRGMGKDIQRGGQAVEEAAE